MTDAEYTMRQDIKERKANGRGIFAKKNGSKSRSCTLPSDGLTRAQWKKKNGEVMIIKLNEKMGWERFKTLAPSLQEEYIKGLIAEYEARQKDIAGMFGIDNGTLSSYLSSREIRLSYARGHSPSEKWLDFIREEPVVKEVPLPDAPEPVKEEEPVEAPEEPARIGEVSAANGKVTFEGNPYDVFLRALKLFDEDKQYRITISFLPYSGTRD